MLSKCRYKSPLGEMTLVAFDDQLCGVYFDEQKYFMAGFEGMEIAEQDSEILKVTKQWLDSYFAGDKPDTVHLSLRPQGTAFQKKVWAALADIPYRETITYGQLAEQLSCKSAQAIGSAVGKNPLSILVPCHRVLGSKGQLTGYSGGLERKRYLLELEKNHDFL
ncbi:methylated-DNA--[protein]-cysteine S-methyltransferase [Streptococcus sp. S784/96/1]|uniref:methylated-DNA--[protein]-cysteine S-methyltransferase n=1 Tax=Streptococcus sp. S784/96/1 TaxID=2653499 RepID=UPI00138A1C93|nr:methylated-DNA--[protein]-cysteine S-methyltransferase [Streptococcus sp. S784/96/1]